MNRSASRCLIGQSIVWASLASLIYSTFTTRLYSLVSAEFGQQEFYAGIVIAAIVTLLVIRPIAYAFGILGGRITEADAAPQKSLPYAFASGFATLGIVVIAELAHAVGQKIFEQAFLGIAFQVAVIVFQVGIVTAAWIAGSRSRWPAAWLFGGLAGGATELALQALAVALGAVGEINVLTVVRMALIGIFAGLTLDWRKPSPAPLRLPIALLIAGIAAASVPVFLGASFEPSILVLLAGWGLGTALCPAANISGGRLP